MSPTFGVGLSTVFWTWRSAYGGVTVAEAVLSAGSGSNWSASAVPVLVAGTTESTVALMVSRAIAWLASVPTVQTPVPLS